MNDDQRFAYEVKMEQVVLAYIGLHRTLNTHLPVAIDLPAPPEHGEGWDTLEAIQAVFRARTLVTELPLDKGDIECLGDAMLDWITALELGIFTRAVGINDWRLAILDRAVTQAIVGLTRFEDRQ